MKRHTGTQIVAKLRQADVLIGQGKAIADACKETWEWLIKDADRRTLPLTDEATSVLAAHQAKQDAGYPYVFVPPARYRRIQELRGKGQWDLSDSRLKVINNFSREFGKILRRARIQAGQFHDLRRTTLTLWLAGGMSEHDVMVLAGYSSFAPTHRFYLAVADDLVHRAREVAARELGQFLAHISHTAECVDKIKKVDNRKGLPTQDLQMGRGGFEPPTQKFQFITPKMQFSK